MTEIEQLERELAYAQADASVRSFCVPIEVFGARWYQPWSGDLDAAKAIRYLELIGKLERHPERKELVRVREL